MLWPGRGGGGGWARLWRLTVPVPVAAAGDNRKLVPVKTLKHTLSRLIVDYKTVMMSGMLRLFNVIVSLSLVIEL